MFGNAAENVGKTITVSDFKIVGKAPAEEEKDETEKDEEADKGNATLPSYTLVGDNLAISVSGKHEDWVEWSDATVLDQEGGAYFDITGYEGYEAYQTRVEASGLKLEEGKNYLISFDIVSSKDKTTMIRIDDLGNNYAKVVDDYTYSLTAGEERTVYAFTGKLSNTVENARVFAGLGMVSDAYKVGDHTVSVKNLTVYEVSEDIEYGIYTQACKADGTTLDFQKKAKEADGFKTWSDGDSASFNYDASKVTVSSGWWGQYDWWTVQFAVQNITL